MGSLEEERLLQMVHDFIESEASSASSSASSSTLSYSFPNQTQTTSSISLQRIVEEKTESEQQILERVEFHMKKMDWEKKNSKLRRWLATCLDRDGYNCSLCHTSWLSCPGCPSGKYEFIDVVREEEEEERVIIDIDFKSQFEVARPTESYREMWAHLPDVFVGGEDKVRRVVGILCAAAQDSLRDRGLHVPPWRRFPYVHSKWLARCTRNKDAGEEREQTVGPPSDVVLAVRFSAGVGINCC